MWPSYLAVFYPYFGPFKVYFVIKKLLFSHKSYMSIGIILLVRMSDTGNNSNMQLRLRKSLKYPHTWWMAMGSSARTASSMKVDVFPGPPRRRGVRPNCVCVRRSNERQTDQGNVKKHGEPSPHNTKPALLTWGGDDFCSTSECLLSHVGVDPCDWTAGCSCGFMSQIEDVLD